VTGAWRQTRLDHAITAVILGFFGSAWFGWAHSGVAGAGASRLDAGSALCVLVAVAASATAFRVPRKRCAVAAAALVVGLMSTVNPTGVAGAGGGVLLAG
jgi:hypothetical protein